ncbi:hypothetical protein LTR78_004988 [Recurvomyces mirabilis]|uniref:ABM domain-containing protein n=1 Tax=Recurvomyces mirabilis TaxID=574656 RepID=A0AAE0WNP8_9PEZI|nr:hypothetical protein LTR78_004988 [Recurvomyces mirabilis]KAK5158396.1 hypothetical protein LTS14_003414 [Recurvomyces mirabilis]
MNASFQLREFMHESIEKMRANEPGCLQFQVLEEAEEGEDGSKELRMVLVELYESREALDFHRRQRNYAKVFQTIQEEGLMKAMPDMIVLKGTGGFRDMQ